MTVDLKSEPKKPLYSNVQDIIEHVNRLDRNYHKSKYPKTLVANMKAAYLASDRGIENLRVIVDNVVNDYAVFVFNLYKQDKSMRFDIC
jgi:hypothetical protein